MSSRRRGPLIAGTWLIGLGVVFLARQAMDLSWSEVWPLFVILVGVASLVSTILDRRPGAPLLWSFTWPIVWIVVGVLLLLSTTGQLGTGPGELIEQGWPWLLVGLGVWFLIGAVVPGGSKPQEHLVVPLRAAAAGVGPDQVRCRHIDDRDRRARRSRGRRLPRRRRPPRAGPRQRRARAGHDSGACPGSNQESTWNVGLTGEVPLDLRLQGGASRARLDLRETKLRRLELQDRCQRDDASSCRARPVPPMCGPRPALRV